MKTAFSDHIRSHFPSLKKGKLLIAISGGLDSVVLTHLLHSLSFDCTLAHCNFKLRGEESDTDETFVIQFGEALDFEVFTQSFNTKEYAAKNSISIQMAARELRYEWFYDLVEQFSFDAIITAHHANDNLETMLINLTRSTGIEGLLGIPKEKDLLVRPLLPFSRNEIEDYAKSHQLNWREDSSNVDEKYLRNAIRHQIAPELERINPNINQAVQKTQENLSDGWQLIQDRIAWLINELQPEFKLGEIRINTLKKLSNPKAYLYYLLKDYGFTEWNDVVNLLDANSGKQIHSKTHILLKDRDYLVLKPQVLKSQSVYCIDEASNQISVPIVLDVSQVTELDSHDVNVLFVDKETLKFPLKLRKWEKGDYFYPLGMHGKKKKLSKFFKDEKYSLFDKNQQWLLCSDNEIVWVVGKRADERFKVTDKTKELLKFIYS